MTAKVALCCAEGQSAPSTVRFGSEAALLGSELTRQATSGQAFLVSTNEVVSHCRIRWSVGPEYAARLRPGFLVSGTAPLR
jgi:hypothetical protein